MINLTNRTKTTNYKLKVTLVFVWISTFALTAHGQNFSKVTMAAFDPLTNAKSEWVDFDNDGLLDLFVSGTDNLGAFENTIFINNGDDTFNQINLDALTAIGFDFGDYNNDGFTDIAISGRNSSGAKFTKIYRSNNGTSFTEVDFSLTDLSSGGIIWEDLDNDGDLDLLLTGLDASDDPITLLYRFDGTNYNLITTSFPALSDGRILATDANNDDLWEIILTGFTNAGQAETIIYTIDNNFSLTIFTDGLDNTTFNDLTISDYNEDGFSDLIQSGTFGVTLEDGAELYQNNGVNGYTQVSSFLQDVLSSSVNFGDLNNDGLTDIILTGIDGSGIQYFNYYQNSSPSYNFSIQATAAEKIFSGDVAIGDYDNDGDLDFFQIGNSDIIPQGNLFESDQQSVIANAAPSVPANLTATVEGDSVRLSWDKSTDDLTAQNSLTYNIYISENSSAADLVLSPLSLTTTGTRLSPNKVMPDIKISNLLMTCQKANTSGAFRQ